MEYAYVLQLYVGIYTLRHFWQLFSVFFNLLIFLL